MEQVLETLKKFREQAATTEELIFCIRNFIDSLRSSDSDRKYDRCSLLLEDILDCLDNEFSTDQAELFAFELLSPCLRTLADIPGTHKLSDKLFSLCCSCVSRGKPKELFIVVLEEVVNLQKSPKNFFSKVFPIFLLVCVDLLRTSKTVFPSDIENILMIVDIAWNTTLTKEFTRSLVYERGEACNQFLANSFMNVSKLSFSVLTLVKDTVVKHQETKFSVIIRYRLIGVILDLMKWVSIFLKDASIFDTIEREDDMQQELIKYGVSLVTLLRGLSMCRRTQVLSLCVLCDETNLGDVSIVEPDWISTENLFEMVENFKSNSSLSLSVGCYLFFSLKSSPLENDCFLDYKYKMDLYLLPIASLFQSTWPSHMVIALWLCRETFSIAIDSLKKSEVLRLVQRTRYHRCLSGNISMYQSTLLVIFVLVLQCLQEIASYNRLPSQVMNTCIRSISDPFLRWQIVYFCLMTSTVVGIKVILLHEMKEAILKVETDSDAVTAILTCSICSESVEYNEKLWSWLADWLFANFLVPRLHFLEDLPCVSSTIHILAFIFWRMKRQVIVGRWKKRLTCRAKTVRTLFARILDEFYSGTTTTAGHTALQIPQEMRNRVCNESLISVSLLDQTLLS